MNKHLKTEDSWSEEEDNLNELKRQHPEDQTSDSTLPLNVGSITLGNEIESDPIGRPKPSQANEHAQKEYWEGIEFSPRSLNPSSL